MAVMSLGTSFSPRLGLVTSPMMGIRSLEPIGGCRESPNTQCPFSIKRGIRAEPTNPEAPVTNTLMLTSYSLAHQQKNRIESQSHNNFQGDTLELLRVIKHSLKINQEAKGWR
ncbi:hypothetical protein ES705_14830 [subsurface metagenome]